MTKGRARVNAGGGRILSDTLLYGLSTVLPQLASIVLLPIYTHVLSPRDYGILDLLQLIVDFTALFVGMQMAEAIFRFYSGESDQRRANEIVSSSLAVACALGAVGFGAIAVASNWLASNFFEDDRLAFLLVLMGATLFLQPLVELPAAFVRAEQKAHLFLVFRLCGLVLRIGLNLLLVVYMRLGVAGAVYANVAATVIQAAIMSAYTLRKVGVGFRWESARTVIGFSLPILIGSLGSYYIGFADRYFLKILGDLETVGLYSMAARFGLVFFAFGFTPFAMAWDAERYRIAREPDAIVKMQQIFRILSAYLIVLGLAISLFAEEVLRLLSAEPFWAAAPLIPIFIFNSLTMAWGSYARFGLLLKRNTRAIAKVTWVSVGLTTIAFVALIPPLGAVGAALAVATGNAFRLGYVQLLASRVYDMKLQWGRVLVPTLVFAVVVMCSPSLALGGVLQWILDGAILLGGAALVWFGSILEESDRQLAREKVRALVLSAARFLR